MNNHLVWLVVNSVACGISIAEMFNKNRTSNQRTYYTLMFLLNSVGIWINFDLLR